MKERDLSAHQQILLLQDACPLTDGTGFSLEEWGNA